MSEVNELWHAMEAFITAKYPGAFLIWDSLNPPGFRYTHNYAANTGVYDTGFFAREYGTVDGTEDRATIAEMVFLENRNE